MPTTKVTFNADTGQFNSAVDGATATVKKQADAVAQAKNKILDFGKAQLKAAQDAGAGQKELARIYDTTLRDITSVSESNASKVIASKDRIIEKNRAVAESQRQLAKVFAMPTPTHTDDITDRQKASALLRGGGIRSAENFLTQFSAFNSIANVAFPILGATTFVAEIVKGVVALKEMYDNAKKLPDAMKDGFEAFNGPLITGVDSLRKTNDELEISIAHLEHKPANTLALALDEARIKADGLASSAMKAYSDLKKVFAESRVTSMASAFTGQLETKPVEDEVNKRMRSIKELERQSRDAMRAGNSGIAEQLDSQVATAQQGLGDYARNERTKLKKYIADSHGTVKDKDGDAINAALDGVEDYANTALDQRTEDKRNVTDSAKQKRLQDAQTQRQQAADAARKVMEAQRKQWTEQDDQRHDAAGDDVFTDVSVWANRLKTLKVGSEQYIYAQHEFSEKLKQARTKDADETKQADAKAQRDQREEWSTSYASWMAGAHRTLEQEADFWGMRVAEAEAGSENYRMALDKWSHALEAQQRRDEEAEKARSKARSEQNQSATAYAEASLAIQQQTGQISRQDAALQQANIHAEAYRQKMEELRAELGRQQALDPNSAGTVNAQAAIDKADADRKVQVMQDAAANAAASWQGALKNANAVWVQDARNSAKQVVELYEQGINGLNENLSSLMTGGKANWSGMFQGLGKTLANDALKKAEAPILGACGLGKADGSSSNPFNVKVVGGSGMGMGGGSLSDLGKSMFPDLAQSAGGDLGSTLGGWVGKVGGWAASLFGGHLAVGGGVHAGLSYDVGEMGRETFVPKTDGYIIPHNKLGSNAAMYSVQVANGVTPEQMKMHVQSALEAFHPHVVSSSVSAMREYQRRSPSTHR